MFFKSLISSNKEPGNVTNALQMSFMSTIAHVLDELHDECCTSANGTGTNMQDDGSKRKESTSSMVVIHMIHIFMRNDTKSPVIG